MWWFVCARRPTAPHPPESALWCTVAIRTGGLHAWRQLAHHVLSKRKCCVSVHMGVCACSRRRSVCICVCMWLRCCTCCMVKSAASPLLLPDALLISQWVVQGSSPHAGQCCNLPPLRYGCVAPLWRARLATKALHCLLVAAQIGSTWYQIVEAYVRVRMWVLHICTAVCAFTSQA